MAAFFGTRSVSDDEGAAHDEQTSDRRDTGRGRGRRRPHRARALASQAAPPGEKTVTATLFERPYASVGKACTDTLGPAGYGYVRGLTRHGAHQGRPVVDLLPARQLQDRRTARRRRRLQGHGQRLPRGGREGDRGRRHQPHGGRIRYGHGRHPVQQVRLPRHSTGTPTSTAAARTSPTTRNREDVQTCELVGLVRPRHRQRQGALHHRDVPRRPAGDWASTASASTPPSTWPPPTWPPSRARWRDPGFWVSEVIYGAGEAVQPEEYTGHRRRGRVPLRHPPQERLPGRRPGRAPEHRGGQAGGDKARTHVDNWDTERNGSTLSYKDGDALQARQRLHAGLTPTARRTSISGYEWSEKDAGPPSGGDGLDRHARPAGDHRHGRLPQRRRAAPS